MKEGQLLTNKLLKYYKQEELAIKLGVTVYSIYAWSRGLRNPRWLYRREMQRLLNKCEEKQ